MSAAPTDWATDAEPGGQRISDAKRTPTPMGALLRFWMPALLSRAARTRRPAENQDFGRGLQAAHRRRGRHRRAALPAPAPTSYGRGMRPALLSWLSSTSGHTVDLPTSPPGSAYKFDQGCSYRRQIGRPDLGLYGFMRRCELPPSDGAAAGGATLRLKWQDCNWLQSLGRYRYRPLLVPACRADQG